MRIIAYIVGFALLFGIAIPEMIDNLVPLGQYAFVMTTIMAATVGSFFGFIMSIDDYEYEPSAIGLFAFIAIPAFWVAVAITYTICYLLTEN